ncbi:MAG: hypothetical protein ACOX7L_09300 [Dethiobacteria bacterium]|jgi:hypothetical protein
MDQATTKNIKTKMMQALGLIREALEMSIPLLETNRKKDVVLLWEAFLREFVGYIRRRSKETGVNLASNISLRKIWFR